MALILLSFGHKINNLNNIKAIINLYYYPLICINFWRLLLRKLLNQVWLN